MGARGLNPCYLGRATASGTRLGRRISILVLGDVSRQYNSLSPSVIKMPRGAKVKPGPRARAIATSEISPILETSIVAPGTHHARTRGSIYPGYIITKLWHATRYAPAGSNLEGIIKGALGGIGPAVRGWWLAAAKKPAEPRIAVPRAGLGSSAPGQP